MPKPSLLKTSNSDTIYLASGFRGPYIFQGNSKKLNVIVSLEFELITLRLQSSIRDKWMNEWMNEWKHRLR